MIALFQPNQFYPTNAAYIEALADAMREEYEAIYRAGFIVQLDCPDLTGLTSGQVPADLTMRIEALNRAVANIPSGSHADAPVLGQLRRAHTSSTCR